MDEDLRKLERASVVGDAAAEEKLLRALARIGKRTARYLAGEHEAVWRELVQLGPRVRDPEHFVEARAIARETMRRVRSNVELLVPRLRSLGYEFQVGWPDQVRGPLGDEVHIPPADDVGPRLDALERTVGGPLPLSLRAFYEIVGTVSFVQSEGQLYRESRAEIDDEVLSLGWQDPLFITPLDLLAHVAEFRSDRAGNLDLPGSGGRASGVTRTLFLSGDALQKAGQSGGSYDVTLPEPRADFAFAGSELFVPYLRETLRRGGFREASPTSDVVRSLARGLVPI